MEDAQQVHEAALEAIRRGEPAAVATVIEARGSTPREVGAKMLVYADGRAAGTVGGGSVEDRARHRGGDAPRDCRQHPGGDHRRAARQDAQTFLGLQGFQRRSGHSGTPVERT